MRLQCVGREARAGCSGLLLHREEICDAAADEMHSACAQRQAGLVWVFASRTFVAEVGGGRVGETVGGYRGTTFSSRLEGKKSRPEAPLLPFSSPKGLLRPWVREQVKGPNLGGDVVLGPCWLGLAWSLPWLDRRAESMPTRVLVRGCRWGPCS